MLIPKENMKQKKPNIHSNAEIYEKLLTQRISKDKQHDMKNN